MTDTVNTRRLALDVLLEVTEHGAYSNQVLRAVLEKYQYMEKYERAFLTRLVEGTIQHMIELDYVIDQFSKVKVKKMKPVIRNILRMGVYQIQYMDSVPDSAACNEAVKLARKSGFSTLSGFVNGVLRNIARNSGSIRYPDEEKEPVLALSVRYSMPEWILKLWKKTYDLDVIESMLQAFQEETPGLD
jgi:16S rRNA (cytosine967-C5)-methyltransferase